jgi:hypothetical protein
MTAGSHVKTVMLSMSLVRPPARQTSSAQVAISHRKVLHAEDRRAQPAGAVDGGGVACGAGQAGLVRLCCGSGCWGCLEQRLHRRRRRRLEHCIRGQRDLQWVERQGHCLSCASSRCIDNASKRVALMMQTCVRERAAQSQRCCKCSHLLEVCCRGHRQSRHSGPRALRHCQTQPAPRGWWPARAPVLTRWPGGSGTWPEQQHTHAWLHV